MELSSQLIKGEVKDDSETLEKYSRDASLFKIRPRVVVFPKDTEDIERLVSFIKGHEGLSLTVRAGGSGMTGGSLSESIIVDVNRHLNKLREIGEKYASVQPGMWYRDFEREVAKRDLLLPSFPASKEICTVGGMVANNSGGERSLVFGKTEKYIEELKVVLDDGHEYTFGPLNKKELSEKLELQTREGEVYRGIYNIVEENYDILWEAKPKVSKNSAGYYLWNVWNRTTFDLTQLFVGSQGTLGIITDIRFRLIRPKKHERLLIIFLRDIKPLAQIVREVLRFKPETFESYDKSTMMMALRYLPDFIKLLKANIIALAWQFLPEIKMFVTGGMPSMILLAEFTGDSEEEATLKAEQAQTALKKFSIKTRVASSDKEEHKYVTIRRESYNLLRNHISDKRTAPFIDDIVVRPDDLPEFLPRLYDILDDYKKYMIVTVAGHVGDGNFHIIPLMDLRKEESRRIIPELIEKVNRLVLEFKGSLTGEHNDGLIRTPYLKDMYGNRVYQLFEETKRVFDPSNMFNPGKKVGGSIDYAMEHIAQTN